MLSLKAVAEALLSLRAVALAILDFEVVDILAEEEVIIPLATTILVCNNLVPTSVSSRQQV